MLKKLVKWLIKLRRSGESLLNVLRTDAMPCSTKYHVPMISQMRVDLWNCYFHFSKFYLFILKSLHYFFSIKIWSWNGSWHEIFIWPISSSELHKPRISLYMDVALWRRKTELLPTRGDVNKCVNFANLNVVSRLINWKKILKMLKYPSKDK